MTTTAQHCPLTLPDEWTVSPLRGARADCCVAPAGVRVRLVGEPRATGETELLFCEHHYRAHRTALARVGATAFDVEGHRLSEGSLVR